MSPILMGVYGAGLVAAGLLTADPARGFPLGTPAGPPETYSSHGVGHLVSGSTGFACRIAACFVFARRYASRGDQVWANYSRATGIVFLAGFVGIAAGNQVPGVNVAFGISVIIAWAWISALCARTRSEL